MYACFIINVIFKQLNETDKSANNMKVAGSFGVTFCQSSMLLVLQKQSIHNSTWSILKWMDI